MMKPINQKEIDDALVHCKSKAACADGYSPKFIKDVSFVISKLLPSAYNVMLKYGRFPKYMLKCHIIFLYKEGRVDLPENYRTIAINNPWSKILWKIIQTRLVKYAEERNLLPALQFGFRSKRSTLSAIFTLKKIILDNFKLKKKTYACFIDLKKAFPSVSRKLLFKRLYDLGLSIELLKLLNYYYNNLKTYIKDGEKISDGYFYSRIGLPEGHVLSPILFALYVGDLELEQLEDEIWIVRKDGSKIWIPFIF